MATKLEQYKLEGLLDCIMAGIDELKTQGAATAAALTSTDAEAAATATAAAAAAVTSGGAREHVPTPPASGAAPSAATVEADDSDDTTASLFQRDAPEEPAPERETEAASSGSTKKYWPPHYSWHMPYDFTVSDVMHLAYALVTLPGPMGQRAADDRALTAKSVANLTAQFSKDAWNSQHMVRKETRKKRKKERKKESSLL